MKKSKIIIFSCVIVLVAAAVVVGIYFVNKNDENTVYDDPFYLIYETEYDGEADYDNDGLLNDEEKELGTDILSPDTDKDGLGDYYETKVTNTNPTKADTDGDTLSDYVEIMAGLDPFNKESSDGVLDKDRKFEEEVRISNAKVFVSGDARIYGTYIENFSVTGLEKTPGVMSNAVEVYNRDSKLEGEIVFSYKDNEIENKGGKEENLAIYTFEDDGTFKRLSDSVVDTEKNIVTAKLKNSAKYLLGDTSVVKKEHETKIMLLIDNSGSMFPEELCEGSDENDVDFKRLDMAKSIIDNINEDVEYGLARFTADYFHMADLGSSNKKLTEEIESIRNIEEEFNGTYIATSIIKALDNFNDEHKNDRKFIIILTDGESTEHAGLFGIFSGNPDENEAIAKCNEKNVAVITIGLGNNVDTAYLKTIATMTGGAYIYANSANALEDVYNTIMTQLVYSSEDIDEDGEADGYVVADSGFSMDRDAMSFSNFVAIVPEEDIHTNGFCFGIATFVQEFYLGKPNYQGNKFEAKSGILNGNDKYIIGEFDVEEALAGIENLRDYNNSILSKVTNIYGVNSKDRYYLDGDTLKINKKLKDDNKDEYIVFETIEKSGTWGNKSYKKVEYAYVDIKKYMEQDEVNNDMEMVLAMYWHWALQLETQEGYKFEAIDLSSGGGTESEFEKIIEKISDGTPLIVSYSINNSGHAINAIRILRDIDVPTTYYLECYDNNDIDNPVIFKIEQSDIGWWDKTSFSNWGENYSVRAYIKSGDSWKQTSLEFEEVIKK